MPTDPEEELAEKIRRFPEQFPVSMGGLLPDRDPDQTKIESIKPPYHADHPYDLEDED